MSLVASIYNRLFWEYFDSLDNAEDGEENPAEQSVIYRYFLEKRLLPCGVGKEEKWYVPDGKAESELDSLYGQRKKEGSGRKSGITMQHLMAGYNRCLLRRTEEERINYLWLLIRFMCEDPLRYREGHIYTLEKQGETEEEEKGRKAVYMSHLRDLFRAAGRELPGDKRWTMRVKREMEGILEALSRGDRQTEEGLLTLTDPELKALTDAVLRTSLHESVKIFFRDMGYDLKKGKEGAELHQWSPNADFHKRKVNRTLDFLDECGERLGASITFGKDRASSFRGEDCETLLDLMNLLGRKTEEERGFVPLRISPYGHMLCILGREFFRSAMEKSPMVSEDCEDTEDSYVFGVLCPGYDPGEDLPGYNHWIMTEYRRMSYGDAMACYESNLDYALDNLAENNRGLLDSEEEGREIPEVFGSFFGKGGGRGEDLRLQYEAVKQEQEEREESYVRQAMED